MRKSWLKLSTLIILIILSCVNVYKENEYSKTNSIFPSINSEQRKVYYELYYNKLSGEITNDRIQLIQDMYFPLAEECSDMQYSTDYDKNKLTGYVFGDYYLFKKYIIPQVEYAYMYPQTSNVISKKASENIDFYNNFESKYEIRKNKIINNTYKDRFIPEYRLTEWVSIYFSYDFSSLLIILMLILGCCSVFSSETEKGMDITINSINKRNKTINAKIISTLIYCLVLLIFFTAFDLIYIAARYGIDGVFCPIYSVSMFQFCPFIFSVFIVILICLLCKLLVFFIIGLMCLLISILSKNTIMSTDLSFLASIGLITLNDKSSNIFNPIGLLSTRNYISQLECSNIFDIPVLSLFINLLFGAILIIILLLLNKKLAFRRQAC